MGGEYAPAALVRLGQHLAAAIPSGRFLGVVGDAGHDYGYHRSRSWIMTHGSGTDDYSVQLAADREGPADAASAVDVGFDPARMRQVTGRLITAAKARDPRLAGVREIFGTLDNKTVAGWDLVKHKPSTADASHLTHVHVSLLRRYATSTKVADGIFAVAIGQPREDDMPTAKAIAEAHFGTDGLVPAVPPPYNNGDWPKNEFWKFSYHVMDQTRTGRALVDLITQQNQILAEIRDRLPAPTA